MDLWIETMKTEYPGDVELVQQWSNLTDSGEETGYAIYRIQVSEFCILDYELWLWIKDDRLHLLNAGFCSSASKETTDTVSTVASSFVRK